jgi:hypothetical protein
MTGRYMIYFQIFIILLILTIIIATSIVTTSDSYYGFYYGNDKSYQEKTLYKIANSIITFPPIRIFSKYSGFDTGYGFFAPNVASDFVILFKVYDEQGKQVKILENLPFKTKEGFIRFSNVHSIYLDKIEGEISSLWDRYLDIILEQMAVSVKKMNCMASCCLEVELYLYDFPEMQQHRNGKKHQLILVQTIQV